MRESIITITVGVLVFITIFTLRIIKTRHKLKQFLADQQAQIEAVKFRKFSYHQYDEYRRELACYFTANVGSLQTDYIVFMNGKIVEM